ncbi:MAG TPA: DUF4147 domain-containing protein [Acidimicrobiales bacterium]|nr:DUF4147 domain-containing protein [Acidimicrobiales bacterium]
MSPRTRDGAIDALRADAVALSREWMNRIDLERLIGDHVNGLEEGDVDVVAIGKAALEMARATRQVLGPRVRREFIVVDTPGRGPDESEFDVWIGDHPIPGVASLAAGERLVDFLEQVTAAQTTLFLVSGGASSLCVRPAPPLTLEDLAEVWRVTLRAGLDITALNRLRASTSMISGGAVLRHVRTPSSLTLVMVDNVISGAPWVGSGLTYEFQPSRADIDGQLDALGPLATPLRERMVEAFEQRRLWMVRSAPSRHRNEVVAEPALMLELTIAAAERLGYRVVSLGAAMHGDVEEMTREWAQTLKGQGAVGDRLCVVGVGEATVRVTGTGEGGRCQEFAWRMAAELARLDRDAVFVARSSDGRDFVEGVGGAWSDSRSLIRCGAVGLDWATLADNHDTLSGLRALGQLLTGGHTGWNLCDLYVSVM